MWHFRSGGEIDLGARLRQACAGLRSDYGSARIAMVLPALFYIGARRPEHKQPGPPCGVIISAAPLTASA